MSGRVERFTPDEREIIHAALAEYLTQFPAKRKAIQDYLILVRELLMEFRLSLGSWREAGPRKGGKP